MLDFGEGLPTHYTHFDCVPRQSSSTLAGDKGSASGGSACAAMQFNFESAAWPPVDGFTVSFWFHYEPTETMRMVRFAYFLS
jgi:hypothetical protein